MDTENKQDQGTKGAKRGRHRRAPAKVRSQRVVTFVTTRELESLEQIADEQERSLSAVVHRIVVQYLGNNQ